MNELQEIISRRLKQSRKKYLQSDSTPTYREAKRVLDKLSGRVGRNTMDKITGEGKMLEYHMAQNCITDLSPIRTASYDLLQLLQNH